MSKFKSVPEFLKDISYLLKGNNNIIKAISEATPWAKHLIDAAGDTLPLVAFFLKYAQRVTQETEPGKQGYKACTLAYNRAVEEAFLAKSMQLKKLHMQNLGDAPLLSDRIPDNLEQDMESFNFKNADSHRFTQEANQVFQEFANFIGLEQKITTQLLKIIRQSFLRNLRLLLAHPHTEKEFAAFKTLMGLDDTSYQTQIILNQHLVYQSWLFQEAPIFREEPFALAHIYLDTECGVLQWQQIKGADKVSNHWPKYSSFLNEEVEQKLLNPFSESDSPRVNLLDKVKEYIGDPDFNEPIIIQGIAGAGKSSFTLRLVSELLEEGFTPIRVLLRNLNLNKNITEAIPDALEFTEKAFNPYPWKPEFNSDWLSKLLGANENITFGAKKHQISPYVFIFDGWDEISTAATTGFQDSIDKVLGEIRSTFIEQRAGRPPIRVIVTGRPSVDVTKTRLLKDKTPVLTMRPLTPEQLDTFINNFQRNRQTKPLTLAGVSQPQLTIAGQTINFNFDGVKKLYEQEFEQLQQAHSKGNVSELKGNMAVLGLPLLTYFSLRLMFDLKSEEQLKALIANPTTLYRALVDITCKDSGNPISAPALELSIKKRYRIHGSKLRTLLWQTAQAMTAIGKEAISREELKLRLFPQDEEDEGFEQRIVTATEDNILSNLIISYYFKESAAGQGCEFLHKSFREYLFAEGVVELLKQYGRDIKVQEVYSQNPQSGFAERNTYWQDFKPEDPRYKLTRDLSELFGVRWITPEIKNHLQQLLTWEIQRSQGKTGLLEFDFSNESISVEQWTYIRDGLADVWDWWGEGVLLRPQPKISGRQKNTSFDAPYVVELAELCCPLDREAWKSSLPEVVRVNTVDARLGEAFFHLTALVHSELHNCAHQQLPQTIEINQIEPTQRRRYQTSQQVDDIFLVRFSPSGENSNYFLNFCSRINAFGWRPEGYFPTEVWASSIHLAGVNLIHAHLSGANLSGANLSGAHLSGANLRSAYLSDADLSDADLSDADLSDAYLRDVDLSDADLSGAYLRRAYLIRADLRRSDLIRADLSGANLSRTDLSGANLNGAYLSRVELSGANLSGANLSRTDLLNIKSDSETKWANATRLHEAKEVPKTLKQELKFTAAVALSQGISLIKQHQIKKAITAYNQAQKLDSQIEISAYFLHLLCWRGSLYGHAVEVLYAGEKAVELEPDHPNYLDTRGLARALTGNLTGAVSDFQQVLDSAYLDDSESKKQRRQRWLEVLRAEGNPFTPEEIKALRQENM
ncbi:MAG: pentapeptide repeat-containing protein [Calothrix sp. MO_167.B42]|nr:pentapeptide repeat-containing protein [Calothrix sp. MO_167.B42]